MAAVVDQLRRLSAPIGEMAAATHEQAGGLPRRGLRRGILRGGERAAVVARAEPTEFA